jgi:hypothetical protein
MNKYIFLLLSILLISSGSALAQRSRAHDLPDSGETKGFDKTKVFGDFYYGIPLSNGVLVDIGAGAGYQFYEKISAGAQLRYFYHVPPTSNIVAYKNAYGTSIFGRFNFTEAVFLQAELSAVNLFKLDTNALLVKANIFYPTIGVGYIRGGNNGAGSYINLQLQLGYKKENSPFYIPLSIRTGIMF